jgi:beta-xylosidase
MKRLGVRYLRTGLSWADSFRPDAEKWFDRQMRALDSFDVTLTFCFTPEHRGLAPHYTSPPQSDDEFAEFCQRMIRRYCAAGAGYGPNPVVAASSPDPIGLKDEPGHGRPRRT